MMNKLTEICEAKRRHIQECKANLSEGLLADMADRQTPPRGFLRAMKRKVNAGEVALIAEIKKASPSKGLIREDFDPSVLAQAYEAGGATCLSVLTDIPYFQGADAYLTAAREASHLPALRKDFILDPYQVLEARAIGADAILLIMAALEDIQAVELESLAFEHDLNVLIEVHDRAELDRALTLMQSPLIGVNNRNLKTLEVDLQTGKDLRAFIPEGKIAVCESGIRDHAALREMQDAGFSAFLVGESLMRHADVTLATQALLEAI